MSHNSFGQMLRVTSWGESHGPAIGGVIDGCPPKIKLAEADIQHWLDRRKPGGSRFVSQRREADQVKILSGVFDGETTGTPIALLIENQDARAKDYDAIKDAYRPSHADYTYQMKYGLRDHRGGGRASARETAVRVAAGGIARKILPDVVIRAALVQIGAHKINRELWDWKQVEQNPFWSPDKDAALVWENALDQARKDGSSLGAVIEVVAENVPVGLGAPVYGKLDADLAAAMVGINAVKGVEIGAGFAAASLRGEDNADEMRLEDNQKKKPVFQSNQAGGVLGGISNGENIVVRFVVKPTSSILTPQKSVSRTGENIEVATKGRHDPCVGIRAAPVGEAMMACVLADHFLRHRAQMG